MPHRILDGDQPLQRKNLHRVPIGVVLSLLVTLLFYRVGEESWVQQLTTATIAVSFCFAALVVAIFTPDWKWRIVGVLVAIGGTGLSYGFLYLVASGHLEANTLLVRSGLRAGLVVGGSILFVGIVDWCIKRWQGNHEPVLDGLQEPVRPADRECR